MCPNTKTILEKGLLLEKKTRFKQAKALYEDLLLHVTNETILDEVRLRLEDMDDLIAEKAVYQRINENAKRVQ